MLQRVFCEFRRVLRPGGRLLFSYANREPAAWVNLFAALKAAGFQPVGYTILHSENEVDHVKRNGRASTLDMILELTPVGDAPVDVWRPPQVFGSIEERYLRTVGEAFLRSFALVEGWEARLVEELKSEAFVLAPMPAQKPAALDGTSAAPERDSLAA